MLCGVLCLMLALTLAAPLSALGEDRQIVITFLGDCTIGGEDRLREREDSFDGYLRRYGMDYFFEKVQGVIAHDDLTVANLEGIFSNNIGGRVEGKTYRFRAPVSYTEVLTGSSVECVNVANNHSLDYRDTGLRKTVRALEKAGISWFGSNIVFRQSYVFMQEGIKIGFLGTELNYWRSNQKTLQKQIESLKKKGCKVIVASLHGGQEYYELHNKSQENAAHWLVDNGCQIVIGHHPHVPQGIEIYKGATICYSLGNFVFGGNAVIKRVRARFSGLFQFTFSFDEKGKYLGHQLNIIPAFVSSDAEVNTYQPYLVTGADAALVMQTIQKDTGFTLKPYVENVGAVQDFVPAPEKKK